MQCKDKFLLYGVIATPGVTANEVTPEMFSKESGHLVEETKLRVTYVAPPRPPSPVHEGSEEGSSPRASVSDNGNASEFSLKDAGGFEALVTGKTTNMQRINVNERITSLERLNQQRFLFSKAYGVSSGLAFIKREEVSSK